MSAPEAPKTDGGVQVRSGFNSDRGLRRELNEDSLIASDPVFAVADGMGGHEAGEVASGICVRTLAASPVLQPRAVQVTAAELQEVLEDVDRRIRDAANSRAGTTLSGTVLVQESGHPYWLIFNIGDSRTYRLSQGQFSRISVDHSEVQELLDRGRITPEQALVHPRRHVITRVLGTGDDCEADYWLLPVEENDRIMICSDGLNSEVRDDQMEHILSTVPGPQEAADALIQAALRAGGRDNVSVIVVDASNIHGPEESSMTAPRRDDDDTEETTLPRELAALGIDTSAGRGHRSGDDEASRVDEPPGDASDGGPSDGDPSDDGDLGGDSDPGATVDEGSGLRTLGLVDDDTSPMEDNRR